VAKAKVYAIKYGIDPKTGKVVRNQIFTSWAEAEPYIKGVKGAEYKSFGSHDEANKYMNGENQEVRKPNEKLYAIKSGQDPLTKNSIAGLIVSSWAEAEPLVKGVKGAEYQGFTSRDEAERYIRGETGDPKVSIEMQPGVLYCFVDGSFNKNIPNYSYGLVCVMNEQVIHMANGMGNNPTAIEMQQIGGELLGAMTALVFAKKQGFNKVVVLHDYQGVANHALGTWKRQNAFSETYHQWMQKYMNSNKDIKVHFIKVDAHTGDDFNEIADGLAKLAVGIKPDPIFYRMLEKHTLSLGKRSRSQKYIHQLNKEHGIKSVETTRTLKTMNVIEKITLLPSPMIGHYYWKCPGCGGSFSWSKQINYKWGHPEDKAFCAACSIYYEINNIIECRGGTLDA